ncbi:prepilin-type N-terminal cleavage/methylation domain-containing protein [Vulcanococcus limneticus Candia 3F8]|uniref:pilus assembly FimT family protein n=1 Tax=Vulcanococcus limneticus TaxID=2170428 RepID=UPI0020CB75F4|nr:prepilin-type N-terminal cleavage/methylation domain-containing protein [Vulcanococcus limneticus]MCP9793119.1 prepilin-type N-terminal cleavage/methylation domain-containing protein [Vulcanococcus limneticus MW73D5]MCP9895057.1 prepilin-type N-terminal cleavage/methylation domain-containing protein [Vulcanococcus limneticus Candia 3F8]MCP9898511.1 prepilin-type N-terminal cleavage/methylation domain-containing protein [Vulcanococcus limneticus Candia 3B3]
MPEGVMGRSHWRRHPTAFTLTELMITVTVLGILSAIALRVTGVEWRRGRVNAVAVELTGWLEAVRRASLKGNPCQVTIHTTSSAPAGSTVASAAVDPSVASEAAIVNTCLNQDPLQITSISSGSDRYAISADPTVFTFTPRGTVVGLNPSTGLEVRISLNNTAPMRCVQISSPLGLIRVGNDEDGSGTCTYPGVF